MASTPFEDVNGQYSDKCHKIARLQIYPKIFNVDINNLDFISTTLNLGDKERILDGEMAVDRIVKVRVEKLVQPIEFTIQERFRRPKYANYKDITITEWNHRSNQPSELYKLNAGIFLYGYANHPDKPTSITEWMAINTTIFLQRIVMQSIHYTSNKNWKDQSFICVTFDDLHDSDCVLMHGVNGNIVQTQSQLSLFSASVTQTPSPPDAFPPDWSGMFG